MNSLVPKKTTDPTAWELYQREHPDWSKPSQLRGFVLLTFSMMFILFGGIWTLQHLGDLILPALLVVGIVLFVRNK